MRNSATIHSVVKTVAISWCKENRETILAKYFAKEERDRLEGSAIESVAGLVAVKRALVALCRSRCPAASISERSFRIGHKENGAPFLASSPAFCGGSREYAKRDFSISIAHNRDKAYGLAAIEDRTDG